MSQTDEKQSKYHKLQIRPRKGCEDQLSVGANTEVLLDGKPLACSFVKFEAKARNITKVMIELYATIEVEQNVELQEVESSTTDMTINGKPVAMYKLGNYSPKDIAIASYPKKKK